MGRRGGAPGGGPADLEHDDGAAPLAGGPRRAQQRRPVVEVLAHHRDDPGAEGEELLGQLLGGDRLLVAGGEHGPEREAVVLRPLVDGAERRAPALREQHGVEGGPRLPRTQRGEGCRPHAGRHAGVPGDVRADQQDPGACRRGAEQLATAPSLLARFAEPRGDHHRGRHVGGSAVVDHPRHGVGGHDHQRHVDRCWDVEQRPGRGSAEHGVAGGTDRMDGARVAAVHQVGEQPRRIARLLRRAHHGDGPRREQALEPRGVDGHRRGSHGESAGLGGQLRLMAPSGRRQSPASLFS